MPIDVYMKDFVGTPDCTDKIVSPMTDAELNRRNVEVLQRRNVIAITSGDAAHVAALHKLVPDRIIQACISAKPNGRRSPSCAPFTRRGGYR